MAFQKIGCISTRKGETRTSRLSARKKVRLWNLIAWNIKSNALFKVSANGRYGMKPQTPVRKSKGAEQGKRTFLIYPCMSSNSFTLATLIFKADVRTVSRAIMQRGKRSLQSSLPKRSALCRRKNARRYFCTTLRDLRILRSESSLMHRAARFSIVGQVLSSC